MRNGFWCSVLGCLALASCTTHLPSVAPSQHPTGKEAIVYGRFAVSGSPPFTTGVDHSSMALVLRCEDGREYRIRYDDDEPIVVLAAAPSTCWLDELLYLDAANTTLGQSTLPGHVRRLMRLDAGRAHYLGDFSGTVTFEVLGGFLETFHAKEPRDEFATTTEDFRERFSNLRSFAPVDLAPARD